MYKKILIPIDGSDKSMQAARHGAELAAKIGASITLIHVIPILPVDIRSLVMDKVNAQGQELLDKAARDLNKYKVHIKTEMITGHPADAICRKVKASKYDLIIMGSRGLSTVKGYLMGSVSGAVTSHSSCPVLIVH